MTGYLDGIDLQDKEALDAELTRREEQVQDAIAENEAAREDLLKELRKQTRLSDKEFNRILEKYGCNSAYAQSLLLGQPYQTKSKAGLW